MERRMVRFVPLFMLGMFVFLLCINPTSATRSRSGSGTLSTGEDYETTLIGEAGGRIEGMVNATEGPLEIYVINSENYVNLSSINIPGCIVYEINSYLEFSFDVTTGGEWTLILRNTNAFNVTFGFILTSYDPDPNPTMSFISAIVFPSFLFLIGLGYVITVQKGVFPEARTTKTDPLLPAVVGLVFIGLSLLLPYVIQLTSSIDSSYADNMMVSLLWEVRITAEGFSFQLVNSTNPYAWIGPMLFMGPPFLYPFALMYYYQGRITKQRMIKIGFVGILPILVTTVMSSIGFLFSPTAPLLAIPLPIVFILGLVIAKYIPAPVETSEFLEM